MPYFILLPLFLGWIVVCSLAVITTHNVASLRHCRPYVVHASIFSSLGILATNLVLVLSLAAGMGVMDGLSDHSAVHAGAQVMWGLGALLGPFAVSVVGWTAGICLGLYLAHRRTRQH